MGVPAFQITFGSATADDVMKADVLSLVVDESTSRAGTCRIELAATMRDDGSWRYLGDERLAPYAPFTVDIGFVSDGGVGGPLGAFFSSGTTGMARVFSGYVSGVELQLGSGPSDATLIVEGTDTTLLMGLNETLALWSDISDDDIATTILSSYVDIVSTQSTASLHPLDIAPLVQRGTDLRFVRELAERNGFDFYFEASAVFGVGAYFRAPALGGTPQADLCVQLGDQSNLDAFNVQLDAPRPATVRIAQLDVPSREVRQADADSLTWKALGAETVTPPSAARMLALGSPTSDAAEQRAGAQALRNRSGWCIRGSGEINSEAYGTVLRPRRTVLIRGAGKTFSGAYYVTNVSHRVDGESNYRQHFNVVRNGSGLLGTERFGDRP